jgi:hypothetical protein
MCGMKKPKQAFLIRGNNYISTIEIVEIERETPKYYIIDGLKYRKLYNHEAMARKKSISRYFSDDYLFCIDNQEIVEKHINQCYEYFKEELKKEFESKIKNLEFFKLYKIWKIIGGY